MEERKLIIYIESNYPISISKLADAFKATSKDKYISLVKTLNMLEESYLVARNDKDNYLPFDKSDYKIGKIKIASSGYGFVDYPEESYYIAKDVLFGAMDGDEVLIKIDKYGDGKVVKVIEHLRKSLILEVDIYHGKRQLYSINHHINIPIFVSNEKEFSLVTGHYVEADIISYYPKLQVKIKKLIGHKNDPGLDITAILLDYQLKTEFPDEVIKEANDISDSISQKDLEGRTNHLDLLTITMDGQDAKDLDDAVSIVKEKDKFWLYVHIADVSYYIKENSSLDKEAKLRSSSIYMIDRVVPMLPHVISNGICSLNPRQLRLTLTCKMLVNKNGEIDDYSVYPSYIQTVERMTYENVNSILQDDNKLLKEYEHLGNLIADMKQCAELIRKTREANGLLDFKKNEAKYIVDKQGFVSEIIARDRGEGEKIIEDFMIAANESVAKLMKWLEIPGIYRVHDSPPEKKISEFLTFARNMSISLPKGKNAITSKTLQNILNEKQGSDYEQIINTMILRSMSKAAYSDTCSGHFGLGLNEYLHFTSPIRRYADLVVHRNLRKYLFKQNYDTDSLINDELLVAETAKHISEQERKIMAAEYAVEDMKKAEYMLKYQNQQVTGIITSITKYGFYVELKNTVEGLVHISSLQGYYSYEPKSYRLINYQNKHSYKLGQKVKCIVKYVNKDQRIVEFEVITDKQRRKKNGKGSSSKSPSKSRILSSR